ncbi:MacS family sensor histidine kinase [Dactylosporangium sp. CA-233914]|uniref:MacS family sensor histidine kinase n=1 Tax=Dactylosporangium sp. CA-233914 TaxID=3239934 RepID=UPI003D9285B6
MAGGGLPGLEGPLWRALLVFRVTALGYAAVLMVNNFRGYAWPPGGWLIIAVMTVWTVVSSLAYARPERRGWPLLTADLAVAAACLLASRWIVHPPGLGVGAPTLPMAWVASPVVAWAISGGRRRGAVAAVLLSIADVIVRNGFSQATVNGPVLMILAGIGVGHIARLAIDAEARLQQATELEAATRERERLARGIHDSVLQVLALVQRRGAELGGEAAELGRLAGDQEKVLRTLVTSAPAVSALPPSPAMAPSPAAPASPAAARSRFSGPRSPGRSSRSRSSGPRASGSRSSRSRSSGSRSSGSRPPAPPEPADLSTLLGSHASDTVTVAAPAAPVHLPAPVAAEVAAAVAAALDNVAQHAGPAARAWILLEDLDDRVAVTIRDDGAGIPDGRLAEAERAGRLGVAQSIRGRIRDLGGTVTVTSSPAAGTEIELTIPR